MRSGKCSLVESKPRWDEDRRDVLRFPVIQRVEQFDTSYGIGGEIVMELMAFDN